MLRKSITAITLGILAAFLYVVSTHAAEAPRPKTSTTPTPVRGSTPTPTPTHIPDTNCQPTYGTEACRESDKLSVDIRVAHPKTGEYVDNVLVNDPKYSCGSDVRFLIAVKNNSSSTLKNVSVTMTLPQEISFKEANVQFNRNGNVLTRTLGDLAPGQQLQVTMTGTLNGQCTTCPVVQVKATAGAEVDEDSTQLCATPKVLGDNNSNQPGQTKGGQTIYTQPENVNQTPKSGAEILSLIGLIPAGLAGHFLRKKSR